MPKILNVRVDNLSLQEILEKVKSTVESGNNLQIITLNTEMIMKAQTDNDFLSVINGAGLVVPESSGVSLASNFNSDQSSFIKIVKLLKSGIKTIFSQSDSLRRIPGINLSMALAAFAEEFGYKLVLLGGKEGTALKTSEKLKQEFPKLKIIGFMGGTVGLDDEKILREVREAGGDIILVAFGHGKQEKWIAQNLDKIDAKVAVGVGGTFDFLSGEVSRAPKLLQNLGLEWTYRLVRQPWRARRQLSLFKFLALLLKS